MAWQLAAMAAAGALTGYMKKREKEEAARKANKQKALMWKHMVFTGKDGGMYHNENAGNGDIIGGALSGLTMGLANAENLGLNKEAGNGGQGGQQGSFIPEWEKGTQGPSQQGADYMTPDSPHYDGTQMNSYTWNEPYGPKQY